MNEDFVRFFTCTVLLGCVAESVKVLGLDDDGCAFDLHCIRLFSIVFKVASRSNLCFV